MPTSAASTPAREHRFGHKDGLGLLMDVFTLANKTLVIWTVSGSMVSRLVPRITKFPSFRALLDKGYTVFAVMRPTPVCAGGNRGYARCGFSTPSATVSMATNWVSAARPAGSCRSTSPQPGSQPECRQPIDRVSPCAGGGAYFWHRHGYLENGTPRSSSTFIPWNEGRCDIRFSQMVPRPPL